MIKLIIAGSRTLTDKDWVFKTLDNLCEGMHIDTVHCGLAKGIDLLGKEWAESKGIPVVDFPADWKGLGRVAGFIRNMEMLEADATHLIALQDCREKPNGTNGTNHMIRISRAKRICVQVVDYKS